MRKLLLVIIAIVTAMLAFFQEQFGLSISAAAVGAGAIAIVTYLFGEAKNDILRMKFQLIQEGKWKDPAFWLALISAILPVINQNLNLNLPVEIIITVISGIIAVIFKARQKQLS